MHKWVKNALWVGGAGAAAALGLKYYLRSVRHFDFADRVVIVTGGARGLGLNLARQLVDQGARVAICSRTQEQLDTAEEELRERGGDVLALRCDIRERDEVQQLVRRVLERWGRIDVLINNAGIIEVGPLDAMTDDDFKRSMDTHCWGTLNMVLAVLPQMRQRGWGRIVNVASIGGKRAVPHLVPYSASKFALVGLSTGLRTELAKDGILVTTVSPGLMRTGSPRNATFKGQHRKEYTWFSISDALPLVALDATTAAQRILRACQNGEADVTITGAAKFGVGLQKLAPNLVSELLMLVDYVMPKMGGIGQRSARGYESHTALSPSVLTRLGDTAAVRNNEA